MTQNLLITGATGFLGSEITRQFHALGHSLTTTGRRPGAALPGYRPCDLVNGDGLDALVAGNDCVVHSAGLAHEFNATKKTAPRFFDANVTTTENVARAAVRASVEHFILISSVSVYGGREGGIRREESACLPDGPYAQSKHEAENRLLEILDDSGSGMRVTILRPATIYGEGDPGNVARVIRAIDRGHFVWIGKGDNRKTLIHRHDAARAVVYAANRPNGSRVETFNVAAPPIRMRVFVETLTAALKRNLPPLHLPEACVRFPLRLASLLLPADPRIAKVSKTVEKFLRDDAIDGRKFARELEFVPEVAPAEGLRREVAWYLNERSKRPVTERKPSLANA